MAERKKWTRWTRLQIEYVIDCYEHGDDLSDLARIWGCSPKTLYELLWRQGALHLGRGKHRRIGSLVGFAKYQSDRRLAA